MLEYLPFPATALPEDELARRVERRRLIADHADQIVPRPAGRARSLWRAAFRHSALRPGHGEAAVAR